LASAAAFCLGREALQLLDADRGAMFRRAIDHILAAMGQRAAHNLNWQYWNISTMRRLWPEIGLGGNRRPFQKPHPPISVRRAIRTKG